MNTIKTYLDNVFAAFPKTEQVLTIKREMLASMEEKYYALKDTGKSEHEAVASVIANFGDIDEIMAELDLPAGRATTEAGITLTHGEAHEYLAQTKRASVTIGIGVWLILIGVAAVLWFADAQGILLLLAAVAVAVVMFVTSAMRQSKYEVYQKEEIHLDAATRAELNAMRTQFIPRFTIQLCLGIATIILAVGAGIYAFMAGGIGATTLPALILLAVGFAVFLFVTAGMQHEAYDILLGRGEYRNKKSHMKIGQIVGTAASVYWPVVTAIYLSWSLWGGNWHTTWIVWPIAGVLFGAIAGGVGAWFSMKEE